MVQNLTQPILSSMPCSVSDPSHLTNALFQRHDTGARSPSHTDPTAGIGEQTEHVFRRSEQQQRKHKELLPSTTAQLLQGLC